MGWTYLNVVIICMCKQVNITIINHSKYTIFNQFNLNNFGQK